MRKEQGKRVKWKEIFLKVTSLYEICFKENLAGGPFISKLSFKGVVEVMLFALRTVPVLQTKLLLDKLNHWWGVAVKLILLSKQEVRVALLETKPVFDFWKMELKKYWHREVEN